MKGKTTTVKDLAAKMTEEKALNFLKEKNDEKLAKGKDILQHAFDEMDKLGVAVAVKNGINASNQITNELQIILKNGG